ncbi:IS630 family transposase [Changchengzhania lutea]|uniref:IS630 family transposase n=1 Tax=Changchengzhania lutea TaxID=2049305 RepID=UPI00115EE0AD|nr:IS630 family transposase [Changchengzhania lutea]
MKTKVKKRKNQDAQEETRLRVADYLRKKLGTQRQAAEIFGITERSVNKIWARYRAGGKRALCSRKRGVQGGMKLKKDQAHKVRELIREKLPEQLKLPFGLWTREAVQQLISQKFGVELSRWQVGRYLKKWGYTPQKPIRKAFEQKPENVRKWLEEEYPAIEKRAKAERAIIYFGDETGCRSDHQAGKSYAPKGKTPIIKATGKRYTVNMISAISNRGHLQFMLMEKGFNSEVFKMFLLLMIKYSNKKIFFITDNHPAHKTIKLDQWLEENNDKIEVLFIPPYSPELNPQEYVNQDLKTNIIGKKRAINKEQLKENINDFMNKRKKDKPQVKKYFHHRHARYAA